MSQTTPMPIASLIGEYIAHLQAENHYPPSTIPRFRVDLQDFAVHLSTIGVNTIEQLDKKHLVQFLSSGDGGPNAKRCTGGVLVEMFNYAVDQGYLVGPRLVMKPGQWPPHSQPQPMPARDLYYLLRAIAGPAEKALALLLAFSRPEGPRGM